MGAGLGCEAGGQNPSPLKGPSGRTEVASVPPDLLPRPVGGLCSFLATFTKKGNSGLCSSPPDQTAIYPCLFRGSTELLPIHVRAEPGSRALSPRAVGRRGVLAGGPAPRPLWSVPDAFASAPPSHI